MASAYAFTNDVTAARARLASRWRAAQSFRKVSDLHYIASSFSVLTLTQAGRMCGASSTTSMSRAMRRSRSRRSDGSDSYSMSSGAPWDDRPNSAGSYADVWHAPSWMSSLRSLTHRSRRSPAAASWQAKLPLRIKKDSYPFHSCRPAPNRVYDQFYRSRLRSSRRFSVVGAVP